MPALLEQWRFFASMVEPTWASGKGGASKAMGVR